MLNHTLRPADRIALIALGGILLSLSVWFGFAYFDGFLVDGRDLSMELVTPDPLTAARRLIAIVGILVGTLAVQIMYSKHLDYGRALRIERSRSREVYEHSPDLIITLDAEQNLQFANLQARKHAGLTTEDVNGLACHELLYGRPGKCPDCLFEKVTSTWQAQQETVHREMADGSEHWFSRIVYPICDDSDNVVTIVETIRDVTELRDAQLALEHRIEERTKELRDANERLLDEVTERERMAHALITSERRYRSLIEAAPDMVLVHDTKTISFINQAGLEMMGAASVDEALGRSLDSMWEPNGSGLTRGAMAKAISEGTMGKPISIRLKRLDEGLVDVELSSTRLDLSGEVQVQCLVRDITERVRAQETIQRMAYYDDLTGLPNRTLFRDRLDGHIARARRRGTTCAVVFIDIDDFKVVNDTLGHSIGDGLLKGVGQRLTELLRETDTVAHQSGDEYLVVAELPSSSDAPRLAERIIEGLSKTFDVDDHELHITTSIGVALYPDHAIDPSELLKKADTAMYRSKDKGNNHYQVYSEDMGLAAQERLQLEVELRRAVEASEFVLHFQPQVDVSTGRMVGVEALIRWQHPERGLLPPGVFLPIAEQTGLITPIGHLVLEEAAMLACGWHREGLEFGRLAVNLSAREFMQPDLIKAIASTLERSGLPPHLLELEITESVAMHSVEHVLGTLRQIRELGVRIAIDDFGTGYSAMSYLQRFPIQTLKIAQTFMRDVCMDEQSAAIATALIELCHVLDLDIVAEGVETLDQVAFLQSHGAHVVQGYAFYRPLPLEDIREVLMNGVEMPSII